MFKNKIAIKLSLKFTATLLIFSAVIGTIFFILFSSYIIDLHREHLEQTAKAVSFTVTPVKEVKGQTFLEQQSESFDFESLITYVHQIMNAEVWIVDEKLNVAFADADTKTVDLQKLPQEFEGDVLNIFNGETVHRGSLSEAIVGTGLMVGVPIFIGEEIVGAVMVHSPVSEINHAINRALYIIVFCILIALVITVILSIIMSFSFTKPLSKMKSVALKLADNDYSERSDIDQNDEIGELSAVLDNLSERLLIAEEQRGKLEKLRRDYVANISHELKTPITVIKGSVEALCENVVTEPKMVQEYHSNILYQAKYLERLVGDLLELSRLQNTDFSLEMGEINIAEVLKDSIRSMTPLANDKHISFEIDIKNDFETFGDYGRLRQMFIIILDNAIKFSPHGEKVAVSLVGDNVSIRDFGQGITKEQLPHIFERFYKTNAETNSGGSGLGLVIAKEIALRHNIEITAKNSEPKGAEFCFKLYENRTDKDTRKTQ